MTGKDIEAIRLQLGLNQREFAERFGFERSRVSKLESQDTPFSKTIEARLRKKLGHQNAHYFTSGTNEPEIEYAAAGRFVDQPESDYGNVFDYFSKLIKHLPPGAYKMFNVEGTSMMTTLFEGDGLVCKRVTVDKIEDGKLYVLRLLKKDLLEYRPSGLWVKRCYHRKHNEYVSCKSDNKETTDPYFTFRVDTSDIAEVWFPVRRLTGNMMDPNRDIYDRLDEIEGRLEMLESLNE